jgi:hypothetical protein
MTTVTEEANLHATDAATIKSLEETAAAGSAREKELERKLEDAERRAAVASASGSKLNEARGGQVHAPRPSFPLGLKLPQGAKCNRAALCSD